MWSVCRWLRKWWLVFVGIWCYSGRRVWIFRALAQFKGSEGSSGLFRDLEDGYIKLQDSPSYSQLTWDSGYDCRFPVKGISVRNLWIGNIRFSFYEICVQNLWGHKTLRPQFKISTLAVQVQLPLVRIAYVFAFQIWYCELCVKKPKKGRQKTFFHSCSFSF